MAGVSGRRPLEQAAGSERDGLDLGRAARLRDGNQDDQVNNALYNQTQFYTDAANGTLPEVTWLLPQYPDAEHPQASIAQGQKYVTGLSTPS